MAEKPYKTILSPSISSHGGNKNNLIKDAEDPRILPCALCGGKACYNEVVICRGFNKSGNLPEDAKLTKTRRPLSGNPPLVYEWERIGYNIHCLTPHCGNRTALGGKRTLEEAIEKWNSNRVDTSDTDTN